MDAEDDAEDTSTAWSKLRRKHERGRASMQDVEAAEGAKTAAQAALASAKRRQRDVCDALLAFDESVFPEARYYAEHARVAPPQGLELLHESGLFLDRTLGDDYRVRQECVCVAARGWLRM